MPSPPLTLFTAFDKSQTERESANVFLLLIGIKAKLAVVYDRLRIQGW
jgi:hypothetical protein